MVPKFKEIYRIQLFKLQSSRISISKRGWTSRLPSAAIVLSWSYLQHIDAHTQAHGQGQDFSSAENSDTSADEGYRAKELVTKVVESVYWADSEEEKEEKAEVAARSSKEKGKCVR